MLSTEKQKLELYFSEKISVGRNFIQDFAEILKVKNFSNQDLQLRLSFLEKLISLSKKFSRQILECSYHLFHLIYFLEKEVYSFLDSNYNEQEKLSKIRIFQENSLDYFFLTSFMIITKLLSTDDVQRKAKNWIQEHEADQNIINTCEELIFNYLGSNIPLISISEVIEKTFEYLELPQELKNSLSSDIEDYVNYAISDLKIYSQFNYILIAFVICKVNLKLLPDSSYCHSLDALITKLNLSSEVRICYQTFMRELNSEEQKETL